MVARHLGEGLDNEEPEDLKPSEGIDNRYVMKMHWLENVVEEVQRE